METSTPNPTPDGKTSAMSRFVQTLKEIFTGNIWTRESIKDQWKLIVLILIFLVVYVNSGYKCEEQLKRISQLQKELVDLRYEYLTLSSELVDKSRQSNISDRLRDSGSNVAESQTPAIKIQ